MSVLRRANDIENWEAGVLMIRGAGVVSLSVDEQEIGSFPEADTEAIEAALRQANVPLDGWNTIEESLAQGNIFPRWSKQAHLNRRLSE